MRNSKGFTLVELAVVLVIIGIILGAVIKGQDLVDNARAKQFTNNIKTWQIALTAYYDRKGTYPGDTDKNGIIGDVDADDIKTDLTNAKLTSIPTTNTFTLGQNTYYLYIGNGGTNAPKVIQICVDNACANTFNDEARKMAESLDTSLETSADATITNVYGVTTTGTITDANWKVNGAGTKATVVDWLDSTSEIKGIVYVLP